MDYAAVLDSIADALGPIPRRIGWSRRYWKMRTRAWPFESNAVRDIVEPQKLLLREGQMAWGAIVQANDILFSNDGPHAQTNAPAVVVYSEDEKGLSDPQPLLEVANRLFRFKTVRSADDDARRIGAVLADERVRRLYERVPPQFSPAYPTRIAGIYVDRSHLPRRRLHGAFLPLLILPGRTKGVMIVPWFLWPRNFLEAEWGLPVRAMAPSTR